MRSDNSATSIRALIHRAHTPSNIVVAKEQEEVRKDLAAVIPAASPSQIAVAQATFILQNGGQYRHQSRRRLQWLHPAHG